MVRSDIRSSEMYVYHDGVMSYTHKKEISMMTSISVQQSRCEDEKNCTEAQTTTIDQVAGTEVEREVRLE
jgi:hypothetical protein